MPLDTPTTLVLPEAATARPPSASGRPAAADRSRRAARAALPGALIFLLGLVLFGGAVGNGFTSWDDDHYVTRNPLIRDPSPAGVGRIFTSFSICNYHPLTLLSFTAEFAAAGLDPRLYHLTNVLLHAIASLLAFRLARAWIGSEPAALLAALLFLAHPLRVESVAWVSGRKDLLCGVFYLGALLAYTRHVDAPSRARWGAALALAVLALLSKAMAVTLPVAMLLLLVARGKLDRRRVLEVLPFAAAAALFAWLGVLAQAADGAVKGLHGGGVVSHALTVPKAIAFYAEKLVWPLRLSPRYVIEPARGPGDPAVLAGAALIAIGILVAARSLRGRRVAFLGLAFFAAALAPVSGIVPSSTIAADRYLYLPAFGLFLALAAAATSGAESRRPLARRAGWAGIAAAGTFLVAFSFLTPARAAAWRSDATLWADALREDPRNPFAHCQLALARMEEGRWEEALAHATRSAELGLREPRQLHVIAVAARGLGDGRREIETARTILQIDPAFAPAVAVVARHEREAGRLDECEKVLAQASARSPDDPDLLAARGALEEARGNLEGALFLHLRAIEVRPGDAEALLSASALLLRLGDAARAFGAAERTIGLQGFALLPGPAEALGRLVAAARSSGRADWIAAAENIAERARRRAAPPSE
jgi:tetratricopeptide (TPR) repeat protein